jgi:hypothetical protein
MLVAGPRVAVSRVPPLARAMALLGIALLVNACSDQPRVSSSPLSSEEASSGQVAAVWQPPGSVIAVLVAEPRPGQPTGVTTEQVAIKSVSLDGTVRDVATIPVGQLAGREPEMFAGNVMISRDGLVAVAYQHEGSSSVRIYDPRRQQTPIAVLDTGLGAWGPTGLYAAEQLTGGGGETASRSHRLIVFDPANRSTRGISLPAEINLMGNMAWTTDGSGVLAYRIDGQGGIAASAVVLVDSGRILLGPPQEAVAEILGQSVGRDGSRLILDPPRTAGGDPPRILTAPSGEPDTAATVWYDGATADWVPRWHGWDVDGAGLLFLAERNGQLTLERHDTPNDRQVLGVIPRRGAVEVSVEALGRDGGAGEVVAALRFRFPDETFMHESLFLYRSRTDALLPLADSGAIIDATSEFLGFTFAGE